LVVLSQIHSKTSALNFSRYIQIWHFYHTYSRRSLFSRTQSFYNFWQADARINLQQNNNRVVHLSQWVFLYHCFFYDATYVNLLINIVMQDLKVLNISNRIKHYHYHHELSVSWLLFDHISLRFHGQTPQQKHLVLLDQDFRHATDTQLTMSKH